MKTLGWVLLVGGLVLAAGSYFYDYGGTTAQVVLVVVAAVGLWLALKKDGGQMPSSM